MVGKAQQPFEMEDVTHHFQRQRSNGGVQTWINITDFWSTPEATRSYPRVRYAPIMIALCLIRTVGENE